ncbi:MAG: outer membrane protein assembly factor BamD [Spirochaetes bacterium]|nr:outer membrane protein assembly factor BamD [Spirochaetota bacterium]
MKRYLLFTLIIVLIQDSPLLSKSQRELEEIINTIIKEESSPLNRISSPPEEKPASEKPEPGSRSKTGKESKVSSEASPGKALLETAIQLYDANLYEESRKNFVKLKSEYADEFGDIASTWIARIFIKTNNHEGASKELGSISRDSGEYPTALYFQGEAEVNKGNLEKAIYYFNNVSSLFPGHELADNALLSSGRIYLDLNRGNQGLECVIKIIKNYRGRETEDDAFYLLGKIFEGDATLRDFGVARKVYRKFLKMAEEQGLLNFKDSPLRERVKKDLADLEKTYFRYEN